MTTEPNIIPVQAFGEGAAVELLADAVATDGWFVMVLSAAGPQMAVNAAIAGLRNAGSMRYKPMLPRLYNKGHIEAVGLGVREGGYEVFKSPIGYDLWHMVAVAKSRDLLLADTADALWQQLNGPRFTTPMLREWMPAIEPHLRERNNLHKLLSFGCDAAILNIPNDRLDEIVSAGIREGRMKIA